MCFDRIRKLEFNLWRGWGVSEDRILINTYICNMYCFKGICCTVHVTLQMQST